MMNAIDIALKMERDAIEFYSEAAGKTKYPAGKIMFEMVINDEKRHLESVDRLIRGLDIRMEDTHLMENIRTVFEEMKDIMMERVEATSDDLEVFKIAMQMEAEGVEFYKKLLGGAEKEKEKILFEKLVGEEEDHYDIFANTYNFLNDTGNWFMWKEYDIVDGGTRWA